MILNNAHDLSAEYILIIHYEIALLVVVYKVKFAAK